MGSKPARHSAALSWEGGKETHAGGMSCAGAGPSSQQHQRSGQGGSGQGGSQGKEAGAIWRRSSIWRACARTLRESACRCLLRTARSSAWRVAATASSTAQNSVTSRWICRWCGGWWVGGWVNGWVGVVVVEWRAHAQHTVGGGPCAAAAAAPSTGPTLQWGSGAGGAAGRGEEACSGVSAGNLHLGTSPRLTGAPAAPPYRHGATPDYAALQNRGNTIVAGQGSEVPALSTLTSS